MTRGLKNENNKAEKKKGGERKQSKGMAAVGENGAARRGLFNIERRVQYDEAAERMRPLEACRLENNAAYRNDCGETGTSTACLRLAL